MGLWPMLVILMPLVFMESVMLTPSQRLRLMLPSFMEVMDILMELDLDMLDMPVLDMLDLDTPDLDMLQLLELRDMLGLLPPVPLLDTPLLPPTLLWAMPLHTPHMELPTQLMLECAPTTLE